MSNFDLKELLIPTVNAQFDAFSQPTFGSIDIGGSGSLAGTVLLSADKTAVKVGDTLKIRVKLNTNDVNITEYRIVIDFDPSKFQVVDADTNTPGTQVALLDQVFEVENQEEDNQALDVGRIRIIAKSPDNTPMTINTDVVEIVLQAQSLGSSTVKLVEGTTGTQIIRQAGIGLSFNTNEVTIDIASEQTQNNNNQNPNTNTNGGNNGGGTVQIPDTGIQDILPGVFAPMLGLALVVIGTSLTKKKASKHIKH